MTAPWGEERAEAQRTKKPVPIGDGYQIHASGMVTQIVEKADLPFDGLCSVCRAVMTLDPDLICKSCRAGGQP